MAEYYFAFFFSVVFFNLLSLAKRNENIRNLTILNCFLYAASLLPLIFLSGFRSYSVGTDTYTYKYLYDNLILDGFSPLKSLDILDENGFKIIEYFSLRLGLSYQFMMVLIAVMVTVLYVSAIRKLSNSPVISFLLFLLLCFYSFHFNAARQGIAIALFIFSLSYVMDRNFIKFSICIAIGFTFHKSIIFAFPTYFFLSLRYRVSYFIAFFIILFFASFYLKDFINFATINIDQRYGEYASAVEDSGKNTSLVWLFIYIFFVCAKRVNRIENDFYDFGLNLLSVAVIISIISSFVLMLSGSGVIRLTQYFYPLSIFLFPLVFESIKNYLVRVLVSSAVFLFSSFYFYMVIYKTNNLFPYASSF